MGKSEKVESFRLPLSTALAVFGGKAAEFNQPSFIFVAGVAGSPKTTA
jgi:hypothetical protein